MRMIAAAMLCLLLLCGCTPQHEIDDITIVSGISVDKGDVYDVCTQIVNVNGSSQNQLSSSVLKTQGRTFSKALTDIVTQEGEKLFFSQTQILLIASDIAENDGISHITDSLLLENRFRTSVRLLICKGSAEKVISAKTQVEKISCYSIDSSLSESDRLMKAPDTAFHAFLNDMLESGVDGILPLITAVEQDENTISEIIGCAVFKDSKMVESFTTEETQFLLMARAKHNDGLLILPDYAFEVLESRPRLSCEGAQAKLKIKLKISLIEGKDCGNEAMAALVKNACETGIYDVLDRCRAKGADPIGIGRCIKRHNLKYWKSVYPDLWSDIYSSLPISVSVDVFITDPPNLSEKEYK